MAMLGTLTTAFREERATASPRRPRTPLLVRAARLTARLLPRAAAIRRVTLSLAGFGCVSAAAWTISMALGLAVAGISLLFVEYLASDGGQ